MKKKGLLIVLVVLVLVVLLVGLVRKRRKELAGMPPPASFSAVVKVVPVQRGTLNVTVKYLGEIVPVTEYSVASKVTGFIENIFTDEGHRVEKGDILVKIDDREIRDKISSLEARIEATKSNIAALNSKIPGLKSAVNTAKGIFGRNKVLYKNKAIGREELDISKKNYELALSELTATINTISSLKNTVTSIEAEKSSLEVLLSYTRIEAPFSGIVSQRMLSSGDLVVPGKPILKIIAPQDGAKVVVRMSPEDLVKMKIGTPVKLKFNGKVKYSFVSSVYPGTSSNNLGLVNILCKNSPFNLPFHTRLEVELATESISGMLAPVSCLLRRGGKNLVVRVDTKNEAEVLAVDLRGMNETLFCFSNPKIKIGDRLASGRESRLMRIFTGQKVEVVK